MFHPIQRFQEKRPEIREKSRRGAGHVIFSRGLLVALLLAVQVLLLVGLFTRWQFAAFAYGGTYALSIFMAFYLINRPMNPTTRQTWLILVLLAPVLGSLLYVFVETDMGIVDLSDLQAGSVTVQGDMGDVTLDNVSASESMTVTQSMGRVTLGNCQGGSLTLENDMGGTQVFQCRFESGNLQGSYGSCDVDESSFDALAVVTDMGDIHLTRSEAAGTAVCQAAQGSVFLERFASPDITLISDMGEVSGTILGRQADYQIAVDTDMGSSNLADQMTGGPNTLEVTTNMGNIELAFEE